MNGTTDRALLSKARAAKLLGVGVDSVNALIRVGHIETRTIPGRLPKVTMLSVQRYIEEPPEPATADDFFRQLRGR
jgi:hypothetical protein